jgi:uncharacterized protein (DUF433 family)
MIRFRIGRACIPNPTILCLETGGRIWLCLATLRAWYSGVVEVITKNRDILGGTPVFRGTRVPIQTLFDYLEGGETLGEFLTGFPTVSRESAVAALEEAKDLLLSRP